MFWLKKFLYLLIDKIIYNFIIFVATKMVGPKKIFPPPPLVLLLDPGSEIWDLGSKMDKNQDPRLNIPDPQHC